MQAEAIGAEAHVFPEKYLEMECIAKKRISKNYRNRELDERIRRGRTKQETTLLNRVKGIGIRAPLVLKVDAVNAVIWMEKISGKTLKEELAEKGKERLCLELGKIAGKMHSAGIIHGDLTSGNAIVENGKIALIDFGLGFYSNKVEDKAVDLLNFKKTFNAMHSDSGKGIELFFEGYAEENPEAGAVFRQIKEIEKRGRYLRHG